MANFKYTVPDRSKTKLNELSFDSYADFDSHCDETMEGTVFLFKTNNNKPETKPESNACFFGWKTDLPESKERELKEYNVDKVSWLSSTGGSYSSNAPQNKEQNSAKNLMDVLYDDLQDIVKFING